MSALLGHPRAVSAPDVSQAEIDTFHAQHFSTAATQLFVSDFLQPQSNWVEDEYRDGYHEEYEDYDEEEDELGYYPDGVKRTLTDEQVAIFRHSELETLRREEERAGTRCNRTPPKMHDVDGAISNAEDVTSLLAPAPAPAPAPESLEECEDGEIESDTPQHSTSAPSRKKKKKNNRKSKKNRQSAGMNSDHPQKGEQGWFKKAVKPDLRKRTWDVVETGMDSLDYDGLESNAGNGSGQAAQRRKISYDD
ncbi:hypothetical protein BKA67DRAFT_533007 [Truncatella angustata]|uniref:Uncharacterized protein n=1 Tax=Truncatella angustata TaxID=152316 RepID=A0A9P8UT88_9PEZI|nr:uncharacterized protein BKA67DRAFT_533007 [Truncatella angustata]KAH6657818.1 hypothetical protein BKA67DRAFT_533007 [Truncatella angustata]